jgi:hypothetical protein
MRRIQPSRTAVAPRRGVSEDYRLAGPRVYTRRNPPFPISCVYLSCFLQQDLLSWKYVHDIDILWSREMVQRQTRLASDTR